jgi:hypothetical protein
LACAGHVARIRQGSSPLKISTLQKGDLERPRHRWEDCIRMDLKEIDVNIRNSIDSAQDRDYWRALVNANTASKLQIL